MKIIAFLLVALLGVSYAFPPPLPSKDDSKVHIPEKCSDVLAVKVCQNLEAIAVRLQLKAKDVTRAVIDAVKQGKTSSMEIYEVAKEFLKKEVLSKKCEDFTTAEYCEKLRKVAALLKVKASKVEELVIEAVAEGSVLAKDIYVKAMEYYKKEIKTKTCEDFISSSNCNKLRDIANKLNLKVQNLEDAIKEAYLEKLGDAKEMFTEVIEVIRDYALNTRCEDVLNPGVCDALRKFANVTKVQFPVLMKTAVDLVIKGYNVSKALVTKVYQMVDYFYDCTDVFDQSSCDRIYKVAEKLGVAKTKVEAFLKKYIPIAIAKGKDVTSSFVEFAKEAAKFIRDSICDNTILCDSPSSDEMMNAFADDTTGFFDIVLIKQKILEYIEIKYPGLKDNYMNKVLEIIKRATSIRDLIKNALSEIFIIGGEGASKIRDILVDVVANIKALVNKPVMDVEHFKVKRDLSLESLKKKLKDFIEEKYPGQSLEKTKLYAAIEDAQRYTSVAIEIVKSFWNEKSQTAVSMIKDVMAKLKELLNVY